MVGLFLKLKLLLAVENINELVYDDFFGGTQFLTDSNSSYLNSWFWKICPVCQLFSHNNIRVMRFTKGVL